MTAKGFTDQTRGRYGDSAEALLKVYPAASDEEAVESAASLASDAFIGYATWKWIETHLQTGASPVFRFSFDRKIPVAPGTMINGQPASRRTSAPGTPARSSTSSACSIRCRR